MSDTLAENVLEAQFEGIAFPVSEASANGGRSHVLHKAMRRRGASIEDTGLDEYDGPLVIPMINAEALVTRYGTVYPDLRDRLMAKLEQKNGPGRFVHPFRGPMTAEMTKWVEVMSAGKRGGTIITLTWIEDNASSLLATADTGDGVPQDYENVTASQAATADAFMQAFSPDNAVGYTPVTPIVSTELTTLATAVAFGAIDASIRTMLGAVGSNIAVPAFAPPSAHDVIVSLYTLQATLYRLRTRLLGRLQQSKTIVTARTMAAWEIAQQQYRDASLAQLIMQANGFEDALAIPAGPVIIPPDPNA